MVYLDLLTVEAPIWPHHWLMMLLRIAQNVAHQFTRVHWTQEGAFDVVPHAILF